MEMTGGCHAQAERMADALVIASVGGTYLFEKAQKEYMRRAPRPYMKIVSAIMSRDLAGSLPLANLDLVMLHSGNLMHS